MLSGSSVQCPDCNQLTPCGKIETLPTNQALLAYSGTNLPASGDSGSHCAAHGKAIEAYAPDTFTLLCIECMLSKQFRHKNAKSVAEGYKDAMDGLAKDERLCNELVARGQTWIGEMTSARLQIDRDRENEQEKILTFFCEVEALLADLKEQALVRLEEECSNRKMKIDSAVQEVRSKMEEASEIGQDKFLEKIEVLSRVKHRKSIVDGVKKCMGALPVRGLIESYQFNSKAELDGITTKVRALYDDSSRPSTVSQKNKKQSGKASNASSKGFNCGNGNPSHPTSGFNSVQTPKVIKKGPSENGIKAAEVYLDAPVMSNNSRCKTPGQHVMANNSAANQGHVSLADKRNEMKIQKHNNQSRSATSNQGTRPSSRNGNVRGSLNSNSGPSKGTHATKELSKKASNSSNDLAVQGKHTNAAQNHKFNNAEYKDLSKMTIKELDDQKISMLSDTCFDNGGITFNYDQHPDSIDSNRYERPRDTESKDESYHLTNYLENLQDHSKNRGILGATGDQKEIKAFYNGQLGPSAPTPNAWNKKIPGAKVGNPITPIQPAFTKDINPVYQSVFNENTKDDQNPNHYRLICMGGINSENKMTAELYDSQKQSWITVERLTQTRINFGLVPLSEHSLLVFGGVSSQGQPIKDSCSFSMTTLSFSPHAFRLSANKFSFGYTTRPSLMYVAGGIDVSTGQTISESEIYDLSTLKVSRLANLRRPRSECCLVYCSTMNSLMAIGGKAEDGTSMKECERLNLATGHWEELPEMLIGRRLATAESINGFIYVTGGYDGEKPLCSVEKYDL